MTDLQFMSFRRRDLKTFEEMLEIAKKTGADSKLIKRLEEQAELAEADIKD